VEETAWADGCPYNPDGKGNWAMYRKLACTCPPQTVDLIAGQHFVAGTVTFQCGACECEEDEVKITITLAEGWRFADVSENVKIQDYSTAPSGNPAPGQFDHKFDAETSPFSVCVPRNCYYGIHVEVERCVLSNNFD